MLVGVLLVASIAGAVYYWPRGEVTESDKPASLSTQQTGGANPFDEAPRVELVDLHVLRRQAWDKIARHLAPADAASLAAIDKSLVPIDVFFAEHQDGARAFAESVLGLRGKWKYVKTRGFLGGDTEDHLAFIDERFRQHVFDPAELTSIVESSIADYVRAVQGIENKLLVTCRADLSDLDPRIDSAIPGLANQHDFAKSYEAILQGVVKDVARASAADAAVFVGSLVAAEITQQLTMRLGQAIATRMGVSAGVLGAGATGGTVSAGLTIGLAVVIDLGIDRLMRLAGADAATKVAAKVDELVKDLHAFIIEGDPTAVEAYHKIRARAQSFPTARGRAKIETTLRAIEAKGDLGLRRMLLQLHYQRARLREAALRKLILEGAAT
jgi:hypothetical protein